MQVSEYSLETFKILKAAGHVKRVQLKVYEFVLNNPNKSILDFEKATGIKHQTASSAFSTLHRKKKLLRVTGGIKEDGYSRGLYAVTDRRAPAVEEKKPSNTDLLNQLIEEIRAEDPSGTPTMFMPLVRDEILSRMARRFDK